MAKTKKKPGGQSVEARLAAMQAGDLMELGPAPGARVGVLQKAKVLRDAGVMRVRLRTYRRTDGNYEAVAVPI